MTPRSPNLRAVEIDTGAWGVEHVDTDGNRWSVCECDHMSADAALECARESMTVAGRRAFETYNAAVGGVTWDGKPIPGWDAVTDKVRDGWRMAALAVEKGQTIR